MKLTTCVINFIKDKIRVRIFRGFDGMPGGVMDHFDEFLKWNDGKSDDPRYMAVAFIFWAKLDLFEDANEAKVPAVKHEHGLGEYAIDVPPVQASVDYEYDLIRRGRIFIVNAYRLVGRKRVLCDSRHYQ
ncbi:MAG: hypothetical protein AABZ39_04865 [Spirochaetota bacterium]